MAFTERSEKRIADVVSSYEKQRLSRQRSRKGGLEANRASVLVKTPANGIPARSGTTLGKADCTIQEIDKDTDALSDGNTLSVYNLSDSAIDGLLYVLATRDRSGNFIAENPSSSIGDVSCEFTFFQTSTLAQHQILYFATQDATKFSFDGVNVRSYVPCWIAFEGYYAFNPASHYWINTGTLKYFNGVANTFTPTPDTHSFHKTIRLEDNPESNLSGKSNECTFSIPHLIEPSGAGNFGNGELNLHRVALGFTFASQGEGRIINPTIQNESEVDSNPYRYPFLKEETVLSAKAFEYRNNHIIDV